MDALLIYRFGHRDDPVFNVQVQAYIEEGKRINLNFIALDATQALAFGSEHFSTLSFAFLLDYDLYVAEAFEAFGLPVYNDVQTQLMSHDRGLLYLGLLSGNLSTPRFYVAPELSGAAYGDAIESIQEQIERVGISYPYLIKPREGGLDDPGLFIPTPLSFVGYLHSHPHTPFVVEESLEGPHLLAFVIGKDCLVILEKTRSSSGEESLHKTDYDNRFVRAVAKEALAALGFPFGMVEIILYGKIPTVIGVNPYFRTIEAEHVSHLPLANRLLLYMKRHYAKKAYEEISELAKRQKKTRSAIKILEARNPND
jgi:hypothetical protein